MAANYQELNSARVSRYELVDMMFKDQFEDVIKGVFALALAAASLLR